MTIQHFDLIVIGAGSGGIATAEKAASYGKSVAVIEMSKAGGTCVNLGCVPKKIMWYAGQLADSLHSAADFGFQLDAPDFDFEKLAAHRNQYTEKLSQSLEKKLGKNKITYLQGSAAFADPKTITVNGEKYSADHIVIASGCQPAHADMKGAEYGIDSDGFFALKKLPAKVAIIGAGYIAMELASMLNQLGSSVKVLLRQDKPLRQLDSMLGESLMEILTAQGIEFLPQHEASEITRQDGQLSIHCKNKKIISDLDTIIFAIGRHPRTGDLNLAAAGVKTDAKGFIPTDKWESTNVPNIYAVGDISGKKLLTPVAIAAGRKLAARIFNNEKDSYLDYENIPTVVFSHPPIGSVGLSEQAAIDKYGREKLEIYQVKFTALLYALDENKLASKMKLVTLKENKKIIGCHLIGPNADEILQGFAVAIKMGATKNDFDNTVAIHPTSAEELVTMKRSDLI